MVDVRDWAISSLPAVVRLRGLRPTRCCQRDESPAIGLLVFTQDHTFGHGFHTRVVARTTRITMATSAYAFQRPAMADTLDDVNPPAEGSRYARVDLLCTGCGEH